MEEHRRKSRPKEKENPLLSALRTKCLKAERRGAYKRSRDSYSTNSKYL